MLPDIEMRSFMYGTVSSVLIYLSIIIVNFAQTKRKKDYIGVPSRLIISKFSPLAEKNKLFRPLASATFFAALEIFFISLCQYIPQGFMASGLATLLDTGVNFFGYAYLYPFVLIVVFIALWEQPLHNLDIFTLVVPMNLVINKIGCFCTGCCNGVWWPGGLYNYQTQREEVPVQLIEAACALAIFIFLLVYRKKAKPGNIYPVFMILYSGTRFISEFWRGQEMVWGYLRVYHILCIIGFALGCIYLIVLNKYRDKIIRYFDTHTYFKKNKKSITN